MQCNIVHPVRTIASTFPYPPNQITSSPSPATTCISFRTQSTRPRLTLKTRATLNDFFTSKSVSQTSFYELLGIPETGSLPEIKQAYKQLARMYHPDVSSPDRVKENTERFIRVKEAYETLSDPQRRAGYDRNLYCDGLHPAFTTRNNINSYDDDDKSLWTYQWQSQVSEPKKRSTHKNARGNTSCGARMRQRNKS